MQSVLPSNELLAHVLLTTSKTVYNLPVWADNTVMNLIFVASMQQLAKRITFKPSHPVSYDSVWQGNKPTLSSLQCSEENKVLFFSSSTTEMHEFTQVQFILIDSLFVSAGRSKYIYDGFHSVFVSFSNRNSLPAPASLDLWSNFPNSPLNKNSWNLLAFAIC